ncbi:unnamed protein product [Lactuca saligna]|uniref:Uncharacterized protein n=1 Tax=Lactuca saligna TaxID=75948 RepID=A0AA36A4W3_LACSI|nr:unnamed protein product [Lactuca saligna]
MLGIDTRVQLTGSGERCLRCDKVEHDDERESEPKIVHGVGSEARHVIRTTTHPVFFLTLSCRNRLHHLFYSLLFILSSTLTPTGVETPDVIGLRKQQQQRKEPEKPLYQMLEEKEEKIA